MAARKAVAKKTAKITKRGVSRADPKIAILAALHKKFGKESATTLSNEKKAAGAIKEFVGTGIDVIDQYAAQRADGQGGLPSGRWSEWFGPEGCGKTALAYRALAQCQREGGVAVLIDAEHSFDEARAEVFGIDTEQLIIIEPESLEVCLDEVRTTLEAHDSSCKMLIVWDSIAAMVPDKELDADAHGKRGSLASEVANILSREMKKINTILAKKRAHIMMINQCRTKFGVMFGNNITTPGGNAPKFYASLRCQFFGGKAVKDKNGRHIAKVVTILVVKSRLSAPFRKVRVRFDYDVGYNNLYSTIEHAKTMKLIDPREDGYKGKGREGIDAYIDSLEALGWKPSVPIAELKAVADDGVGEVEEAVGDEEDE